jgi:hypothetical protein
MAKMMTVEVFVCVGDQEEYVCNVDEGDCAQAASNELSSTSTRMIKVVLTVPVPEPIVMTGTVPAEPTEGTLTATTVAE